MTIKRIFLTLLAGSAITLSALAQTARSVLDESAAKLRASAGIEANFEATQFTKGLRETGSTSGSIQVQGTKFKVVSNAVTTWFDGRTQWTLLTGSDEVNVSTPTAAEVGEMNPYTFINLYKQGYTLRLNATTYNGKAAHEVRMTAQSTAANVQTMIVVVDKQTHLPLSIRMKNKSGEWTRIRVKNVQTGKRWADTNFKYNEKQHPGVSVIDLR